MACRKNIILGFVLILTLSGCTSSVRFRSDFSATNDGLANVLVMPPEIAFGIKKYSRVTPKPEYRPDVERNVQDAIEAALKSIGVKVSPNTRTNDLLRSNAELARSHVEALESFGQARASILQSDGQEISVELDADLKQFVERSGSKYIILARGSGFQNKDKMNRLTKKLTGERSSNKKFWDGLLLEIALVEAKTAEVVWFNKNNTLNSDYDPLHFKSVKKLCKILLRDLKR